MKKLEILQKDNPISPGQKGAGEFLQRTYIKPREDKGYKKNKKKKEAGKRIFREEVANHFGGLLAKPPPMAPRGMRNRKEKKIPKGGEQGHFVWRKDGEELKGELGRAGA